MERFAARGSDELVAKADLAVVEARLRTEMHQLHNRTITILIGAMGVMTAVLSFTT